jgi:hypothetical protein
MKAFAVSLLFLIFNLHPSSTAAVVNIDIQGAGWPLPGAGAVPVLVAPGGWWNSNGENGEAVALRTSEGFDSGWFLVVNLSWVSFSSWGDALFGDSRNGSATIFGLEPGSEYQIVCYAGANYQTLFRFAQPFTAMEPAAGGSGDYRYRELPGVAGDDYTRGTIVADEFGRVTVEANLGTMAGLQLARNPEAGAGAMVLVGGVCGLLRRRRVG